MGVSLYLLFFGSDIAVSPNRTDTLFDMVGLAVVCAVIVGVLLVAAFRRMSE